MKSVMCLAARISMTQIIRMADNIRAQASGILWEVAVGMPMGHVRLISIRILRFTITVGLRQSTAMQGLASH